MIMGGENLLVNITKLFNDEVRDKKRTASGVHHKTGKRGYTGKIYFASDLLRGRDKREYQGTGKVIVYNMYDKIMPIEEFEVLPTDAQKQYLTKYREKHSNKEIMKVWSMGHNKFYYLLDKLDITKANRKPRKDSTKEKRVGKSVGNELATVKEKLDKKEKQEQPIVEIIERKEKENGMTLSLNGTYSADEIVRKLEKFGLILSDEPSEFKVELKISEMA